MNYRTRLKQLLIATLFFWLLSGILIGAVTFQFLSWLPWFGLLVLLLVSAVFSALTLNQSQGEVARVNKEHSRTKRTVQEQQLKLDRFEYDAKKSGEMRRIVLNSTQEKDHALKNMAEALNHSMDELQQLLELQPEEAMQQMQTRVASMKRYAGDLQHLAQLELKKDLPEYVELDFLEELLRLIDQWNAFGKSRNIRVKLENAEEQIKFYSDSNWLDNLLSRIVLALIRLNEGTKLNIHLISYMDADIGDALRVEINIDGWQFSDAQSKRLLTEYVSVEQDGQEVGPGLSFVVARRMAQMLNGSLEIDNSEYGVEVLILLPQNPSYSDDIESLR